jgi:CRISPR-associated protein Csd2
VYLFDVKDGNPNGDPDAGNSPRMDAETGHGLVSDVCLKRKVRDFVAAARGGKSGYEIYVKLHSALHERRAAAYDALKIKDKTQGKEKAEGSRKAREWMCRNYYDVRAFGAVMSMDDFNCGQVRGPLQFTFGRSIDVIADLEQAIVRKAVEKADAEKQLNKDGMITGTIGRKSLVPYALFRSHVFFNPLFARDTGFSAEDLSVFVDGLGTMFDLDRSAARGQMSACKIIAFQHESPLGNAPAGRLFDRIEIKRKDASRPPRRFADYEVLVNREGLPKGVTLHEIL